jgi:hypothetical protein
MSEHAQQRAPVNYDELFPGRFLKAGLFVTPRTLTIKRIDTEPMPQDDGRDRVRGIISFERTDKQLVLNSTNGQCLRAMFGSALVEWIGKRVTFQSEQDRFGKDVVDAIRIVGSPDLAQDLTIEVKLPRKKPKSRVLRKTVANGRTSQPRQAPPAPPPPDDPPPEAYDPETGEVPGESREPGEES